MADNVLTTFQHFIACIQRELKFNDPSELARCLFRNGTPCRSDCGHRAKYDGPSELACCSLSGGDPGMPLTARVERGPSEAARSASTKGSLVAPAFVVGFVNRRSNQRIYGWRLGWDLFLGRGLVYPSLRASNKIKVLPPSSLVVSLRGRSG